MKKARVIVSMEHQNFKQFYNELLKSGLVEDVGEETNAEFIRQEHEKNILKPIYHHPDLVTDIENISVINQIAAEYKIPVVYSKINKIEFNISELDGVEPLYSKEGFATYKISHNSLMQLPYMKRHFEYIKRQNIECKEQDNKVHFRWDKNGIITDLYISTTGASIWVSAEDIQTIIDLIKVDNV